MAIARRRAIFSFERPPSVLSCMLKSASPLTRCAGLQHARFRRVLRRSGFFAVKSTVALNAKVKNFPPIGYRDALQYLYEVSIE